MKLEIFDPPMCCSSGVCGPNVDKVLVQFSADLDWLTTQGIEVKRYNLSQQPDEFVKNELVRRTLQTEGNKCLPVMVFGEEIISRSLYPTRSKLAELLKLKIGTESTSSLSAEVLNAISNSAPIKGAGCCDNAIPIKPQNASKNRTCC